MKFVDMRSMQVPVLGFGTWELRGALCRQAVRSALDIGYRHIDTAQAYENEADVGQALADARLSRDELFITTKVWMENASASGVKPSVEDSLKKLKLDYVNLLLLHWPVPNVPMQETLNAMAALQKEGRVKAIGVSNFPVALMREAVERHGIDIACNQVEYHVQLSQKPVLEYARRHDIIVTAYSPLGRAKLTDHPLLVRLGQKYEKTAAQVALRWLIEQKGVMAIPKAASEKNAQLNFNIFDFVLNADDYEAIEGMGFNARLINPTWAPVWDKAA
jgi:2,5-diketo-D-gluconate reductase B